MSRTSKGPKGETFTFRLDPGLLDPGLKAALTQAAAEEHKPPGELIRSLLEEHLARKQRPRLRGRSAAAMPCYQRTGTEPGQ